MYGHVGQLTNYKLITGDMINILYVLISCDLCCKRSNGYSCIAESAVLWAFGMLERKAVAECWKKTMGANCNNLSDILCCWTYFVGLLHCLVTQFRFVCLQFLCSSDISCCYACFWHIVTVWIVWNSSADQETRAAEIQTAGAELGSNEAKSSQRHSVFRARWWEIVQCKFHILLCY